MEEPDTSSRGTTTLPTEERPWFSPARVVAFAVLASIPVKLLSTKLADPDLWWHLQTGELIARDGIPDVDPFSYTAAGQPWVVQEWGAELLLHWLREAFGLYGIFFYRAIALFLLYVLVARLLVRRMGSGIGTWALLGLIAYAGGINWTERPNLISFLFFVATLTLLERRDRRIWLFVPLAIVWANVHGMVIIGVGVIAVVAAAEGLKAALAWEGADGRFAKRLALVAGVGLLATFVNPEGPGLLIHVFRLVGIVTGLVSEWASPDFHEIGAILFLLLLLLTVVGMALSPRRPDPTDVALSLAFAVLALQALRNLAVASIVLGLVAAKYLPDAVRSIPARPSSGRAVSSGSSTILGVTGYAMAAVGLGLVLVLGFPTSDDPAVIVDDSFPIEVVDRLDTPGVRVFALDSWSGMIIDRAWPNATVYVDLRWDFYGRRHSLSYVRTITADASWRENLDVSCTTHVLIRPRSSLTQVLLLSDDWRIAQEDDLSITFARVRPARGCSEYPIPEI